MNFDKRLLKYILKHKFLFATVLCCGILNGTSSVALAWFLSRFIDAIFLQNAELTSQMDILMAFLASAVAQFLFIWLTDVYAALLACRIKNELHADLSAHLLALGPVYTRAHNTGDVENTMTAAVQKLDAYFSLYIPQVFFSVSVPLLILIFVFPLDSLSGFVLLFTAPLIPLMMILIGDAAKNKTDRQWKLLAKMSAFFLDTIQGLTMLKILGQSEKQVNRIREISENFRHATMSVLRIAFISALALELLATLSTAVIAVEIGLRLLYAKMAFVDALFILIIAPSFYLPLRQLGVRFHAGMEGLSAAESIYKIFAVKKSLTSLSHKVPHLPAPIRFENVAFRYEAAAKDALQNVTFVFQPNQHTALIGPSGAGKTTIFNLLLKFLSPSRGDIWVGSLSLAEIDPEEWRKFIAWVPQQPYLFQDSLLENIRLGKKQATQQEIVAAAQKANLHDFITTLPDGYHTEIGERGLLLSGGEAQRLSIARALLLDAPIVLLDEPTFNLDPFSEKLIQQAIDRLTVNRSVITIAHRRATIKNADRIILLKDGHISTDDPFFYLKTGGAD